MNPLTAGSVVALALLSTSAEASTGGGPIAAELAGNPLTPFPHFEYVKAFNEGTSMNIAVDPGTNPGLVGQTADLYVVASKNIGGWTGDPTLTDLTAAVETVNFTAGTIQANTFQVDDGSLNGTSGTLLGVAYDVVIDVNQNGILDNGDYIDGYSNTEAGAYVVRDTTQGGPFAVKEILYSGGTWLGQNTFYPTNISSMGELPLVIISHGNGHNYQWYDHIGNHLASYGYVVMSHTNQTGPGVTFAATTTLTNTDYLFDNITTIEGGELDGHIDGDRITWIGHSRGGEGICIAYDRLYDGAASSPNYDINDLLLLSSIAPTDFQEFSQTNPHEANFHLWTGQADSDVNGCASCNLCQTFHLHDRATRYRQQTTLHGVGHAWFHNNNPPGSNPWASGPCLIGEPTTHLIELGYMLPLVEHYVNNDVPSIDFLTRQYESFRPIGVPFTECVKVDTSYRAGLAPGKLVIDDYQANFGTGLTSTGIPVFFNVDNLTEGDLDDPNTTFTHAAAQPMNGMTVNGDGPDDSKGVVFEWNNTDKYMYWSAGAPVPLSPWKTLSFRACQATRHNPLTIGDLFDTNFTVTLVDASLNVSSISTGAFGGAIEEPYPRTSCGTGAGWANSFETIRIPLDAFRYNGSNVDLNNIIALGFQFGPSHGSATGRIGIDDIELLQQ